MSVTGGTIAPPVNMLDEVLALNNIQHTSGSKKVDEIDHMVNFINFFTMNMLLNVLQMLSTSGSVNFPFHVEEPYNTTGVRQKKKKKKKTRIPILRTLEVRMPKFAHERWFAYARRHEYQIVVCTQKNLRTQR